MRLSAFKPIDNAPLIVFRICFGLLLFAETFGAILTGWVKRNLIDPEFTFSHVGFEWLQPLPGLGMYFYFGIMAILGLAVAFGFRYKWTLGTFTILWTAVYLMQKESYNNHYYLLLLVSIIMWFLPANSYASLDAKRNPKILANAMPAWCSWVMIAQISIVYFFATIAKFYPDWLNGNFIGLLLQGKEHYPVIGRFFTEKWFHLFLSWGGIFFDGLVILFLLFPKTRTFALFLSLLFHLFNAVVLQIGIFPFFALSFVLFFYPPELIRSRFLPKKPIVQNNDFVQANSSVLYWFFIPYFIIQFGLPLRHWAIQDDVLWTEEGHRLSWRMMLRQRTGFARFRIEDKNSGKTEYYDLSRFSQKQRDFLSSRPDGIWQFTQRIKKEYEQKGWNPAIFVHSQVSVNGSNYYPFTDPNLDMANEPFYYFGHSKWITPSPLH